MSSLKLFPYKMRKGKWYRADDMSESDVIVIVDTKTEIIWFHEGSKSSARNRSNAREMLGQLKQKYIPYKFKRVTANSPEDILDKIDTLKEKSFTGKVPGIKLELKDYSRIFYILNLVSSVLIILGIIILWMPLFSSSLTREGALHFSMDFNVFLFYADFTSLALLISSLIFGVSAFFGAILKKTLFSALSVVAAALAFAGFFILRIWDVMVVYELDGNSILIRFDALTLFILNIQILMFASTGVGFLTAVLGLKNIQLFERVEELHTLTLPPEGKK